jgi:hypothetical protein
METLPRIDRLIRSLVGVTDLRLSGGGDRPLTVHVLRDARVQDHQLIGNIVSGLRAGLGIALDPARVRLYDAFDEATARLEPPVAAAAVPPAAPAGPAVPPSVSGDVAADASASGTRTGGSAGNGANGNGHANGNGNGHAHGNGHANGNGAAGNGVGRSAPADHVTNGDGGAALPADPSPEQAQRADRVRRVRARGRTAQVRPLGGPGEPAHDALAAALAGRVAGAEGLQLHRVDVERHGGKVRCRVVLERGEERFAAVADALDGPTAEAELAARVALDALRAGGIGTASLDGVSFITIGDTNYVAAAVRHAGEAYPRASTAPLVDSTAWSSAVAVLSAADAAVSSLAPVPFPVRMHEPR